MSYLLGARLSLMFQHPLVVVSPLFFDITEEQLSKWGKFGSLTARIIRFLLAAGIFY